MSGRPVRYTIALTMSVVFLAIGIWFATAHHYLPGAFLIAVASAFPLAWLFARISSYRGRGRWLRSAAIQPAILTALALILGISEVTGIGFKQDIGRGVLAFIGAAAFGYGTLLIARKYGPSD